MKKCNFQFPDTGNPSTGFSKFFLFTFIILAQSICVTGAISKEKQLNLTGDALSVLADSPCNDESDAVAILHSDILLEAKLMLVRKHGSLWKNVIIDKAILTKARRIVVLTSLLARRAKQIGETIEPRQREYMLKQLIGRIGSQESLDHLLNQNGMTHTDLDNWIDKVLLALSQINYLKERINPPSDSDLANRFKKETHPFVGMDYDQVKKKFRKMVMDQLAEQMLDEWLKNILEHRCIRLIK